MARKALSLGYFVMMQIRAGLRVAAQGGVYPFGTHGPDDAQRLAGVL